jgi:hypothetical protein
VARAAGFGDGEAAVRALRRKFHARQTLQARAVLQPRRPRVRAHQPKPVQRRAAACLQIGFVPHLSSALPEGHHSMNADNLSPTLLMALLQSPVAVWLFWTLHGIRRELDRRIEHGDLRNTDHLHRTRDELAEFKLEVARTYVPLSLIREMDRRVTEQLQRIETKIDEVGHER